VMHGLMRVRGFTQDDAHVFCLPDQISDEILAILNLTEQILSTFDFRHYEINLSTRPEKSIGEDAVWELATQGLIEALDRKGWAYKIDEGGGAFYGPKIDITIQDALRRSHQCATIQLDFQLPERFNLSYVSADEQQTKERPVIIHRAILGSVERMIAILTESFGGKWPFWLSPRQSIIVTVSDNFHEYALKVKERIYAAGFECDYESDCGNTLNKKIRNAQLDNYNFILVIGEKEQQRGTVNIRTRDNKVHGEFSVDEVLNRFREMETSKTNQAEEEFGNQGVTSTSSESKVDSTTNDKPSEPMDPAKYC